MNGASVANRGQRMALTRSAVLLSRLQLASFVPMLVAHLQIERAVECSLRFVADLDGRVGEAHAV